MKFLSDLKVGQAAKIKSFLKEELSIKFLEIGCIPSEVVKVEGIAPLGDPISISLNGSIFILRKKEAASIIVEIIS